jgi:hypothetical protein
VHKVFRALLERLGHRGYKVLRVFRVPQAPLVLKEYKVPRVMLVQLALKEFRVFRDLLEQLEHRDCKVLRVFREL